MYYYGVGHKNNYLGSGKFFKRALKKYGSSNFEKLILKWFSSPEDAFNFEDRFLKFFNLKENVNSYNLCNNSFGGDTMPMKGTKEYEDRIKKMSKSSTANNYKVWANRNSKEREIIGSKISHSKSLHDDEKKKEIYEKWKSSFLDDEEKVLSWKNRASNSAKLKYEKMSELEKRDIAKKTVETRQKNLEHLNDNDKKQIFKDRHASATGKKWYYNEMTGEEKLLAEIPGLEWKKGRPSTAKNNKLKK
jgi:hypothetical protein